MEYKDLEIQKISIEPTDNGFLVCDFDKNDHTITRYVYKDDEKEISEMFEAVLKSFSFNDCNIKVQFIVNTKEEK